MELSGNKILITGGASGIGLGLTERFIHEGNQVIICGRRADALKKVTDRHPYIITRVCDLSIEEERIALFDWISDQHKDLNVLVNNAGVQNWMDLSDKNFYDKARKEMEINVIAPLHLNQLFLELANLETIINVTSALAFVPMTKVPVYCGTKAFMHSYTLTLRHLLMKRDVEVLEIIPPALNTDLGGKGLHTEHPPVSEFIEGVFQQLTTRKKEITFGYSEVMANAGPEQIRTMFDRINPL